MSDEYLQPGFDANTLTVPRLRSILVEYNVEYPSSAKKPELVELFNDNIGAEAKKIRDRQARTKRTSKGIVSVSPGGRAIDGSAHPAQDEDELAPLQTPARKTSARRSTRAATEETVAATPRTSRSARQSTVPLSVPREQAQPASYFDGATDELAVPKPRRTRQSMSPGILGEPPSTVATHTAAESPFTQDNPFQRGSPPRTERSKSASRRRTTNTAFASDKEEHKPTRSVRRQTQGRERSRSRPRENAVARVKQESDSEIMPGEEFTPDQQLELETALAGNRALARRHPRKSSGAVKAAPWSVLVALLGGLATVWRQEKLNVGYCGIGRPSTVIAGVEIPDWAAALQPQCEPCPPHAYCYADLKTVCEPDFVLTPHPLNLNGLVPLAPTCEPDGEKARRVKAVADFAVEKELRERNAKYECGEIKKPEVSIEELKTSVAAKRSRKMTDEEFEELWKSALGEITSRDEVTSKADGSSTLLHSTSLARISLGCAIRRSLYATIRQHIPKLVALVVLSLSAVYGRHSLIARRSTSTKAKTLAGHALEKLAIQGSLHAENPSAYPEGWISMVALRDDVLREEFNARERSRLWEAVKSLVEGNANVRSMVREGRSGDVSRVWEWTGAVQRLESPDARRQSGRYSLTGITDSFADEDEERSARKRDVSQVSRWSNSASSYY